MAISVVQQKSGSGLVFTGSLTITLSSPTTAGNCLVVVASQSGAGSAWTSMTLGGSVDNFALAKRSNTNYDAEIWIDPNCAGGQTSVVLGTSGSSFAQAVVYEVAGLLTTSPLDVSVANHGSGTAWSSGTSGTTAQANEIFFGCLGVSATTVTGPASPWVNTQVSNSSSSANKVEAGQQVVSATGTVTYSGTQTSASYDCVAISLKSATSNVSVSLTTAQVSMSAPAPGIGTSAVPLTRAQVNIAAPAPVASARVSLAAAQVNIAALPFRLPVLLTTARVNIAALPVAPTVGLVLPITTAQVNVSALPVGLRSTPALSRAQIAIAALPVGFSIGRNVALTVAQVTISARPVSPGVSVHVNLTTVQVGVQALPVKVSRQLIVSLASVNGTDDYGNSYNRGVFVGGGFVQVGGPASQAQVSLLPSSGSGTVSEIQFPMPSASLSNTANIAGSTSSGTLPIVLFSGPALSATGKKDWVQLLLYANSNTGNPARMEFRYIDTSGSAHVIASFDSTGWTFQAPVTINNSLDVVTTASVGALSVDGFPIAPTSTPSLASLPDDTNSGTTWVSGERAFMNNNWVDNINSNFVALIAALQDAGIFI